MESKSTRRKHCSDLCKTVNNGSVTLSYCIYLHCSCLLSAVPDMHVVVTRTRNGEDRNARLMH